MKKLIIIIVIGLIAVFAISAFSFDSVGSPLEDDEKSTTVLTAAPTSEITAAPTSAVTTPESEPELEENTFYYLNDSGETVSTTDITALADGVRGYFLIGDTTYFAIVDSGTDSCNTYINLDMITLGDYTACSGTTTTLSSVSITAIEGKLEEWGGYDYTGGFYQKGLVIYCFIENCSTPAATHADLLTYSVSVAHADPGEIDGPSAS